MSYLPQSDQDLRAMLEALGLDRVEQLFDSIPGQIRERASLDLPAPLTEIELARHMTRLAGLNRTLDEVTCFAGGGIYDRFIPAIVSSVTSRPEFVTPYTPYQPEASQGTLQAMFQYQTMICELMDMDVANASLYDGATALGEAVLMACSITKRSRVLLSAALAPAARRTCRTYCEAAGIEIVDIPWLDDTGRTDLTALEDLSADDVACVALQQPNYFGVIEDMAEASTVAHDAGALFVASVEPISLGLLKPPGAYEADIAVGEGQPLGLPPGFGGPLLGLMACREEHMRSMPGRVVGRTTDADGNTAYCLTLQTREQHIRRERATSNICTNQGLCALAATVYLAALGPDGLSEAARLSAQRARYLHELVEGASWGEPRFTGPFVNEFVVRVDGPADDFARRMCREGYLVGPALGRDYPGLDDCLLMAVTERRTRAEIEALVAAVR
ncbi:MAG: aminomethyl-transferring glycine dehydrogenase subunit GcvPA [Armatimonadetes bacterium]|nr:aminomethyl-transferring glycine dehydrogenase subunit GcvPA [Armatimonadota bacterium]